MSLLLGITGCFLSTGQALCGAVTFQVNREASVNVSSLSLTGEDAESERGERTESGCVWTALPTR